MLDLLNSDLLKGRKAGCPDLRGWRASRQRGVLCHSRERNATGFLSPQRPATLAHQVKSMCFRKSKTNMFKRVFLSYILAHFSGNSTHQIRLFPSNGKSCLILSPSSPQNIIQYSSNGRNCLTFVSSGTSQMQPERAPSVAKY